MLRCCVTAWPGTSNPTGAAIWSRLISNFGQGGTNANTYTAHNDINQFILTPGNFDSLADFYNATRDPANTDFLTTKIQIQFATHSDPTGTPDWLHLGRAGAQAEADQLDVGFFRPRSGRH